MARGLLYLVFVRMNTKRNVFLILLSLPLLAECGSGGGGGGSSTSAAAQTTGSGTGGSTAGSVGAMSVGDVVFSEVSSGSGSISFSGASSGSTYELLVQSQATDNTSRTVTLGSLNAAGKSLGLPDPMVDPVWSSQPHSVQTQFEGVLRDEERFLLNAPWSGSSSKSVSAGKSSGDGVPAPSATVSVNDTDTFRVLSSLSDVTQYSTVNATVKCVNDTVAIYIDDEITSTNPSDLSQADIDNLCAIYKTALTTEVSIFGSYPDLNSDGVAVGLITPVVNRLSGSGGGVVTGFFYAGDLFARSGSIPASNYREIVYLVSPDSAGVYGTKISNAFAMSNFLPPVFPHEMQHLINYYQHTIVRAGSAEDNWLNEAISHFTEDLVGYGRENYSRYDLFLDSPQSNAVVTSGSPSLAQRGAGYLFLRYLYEQSGLSSTFLGNLVKTTNTGVNNIVAAYAGSGDFDEMAEFLKNWAVALGYTDRSLTSSTRFKYNARTFNNSTGNYQGVCLICTPSDGRSTILSGPTYSTYSGAANYGVVGTGTRFLRISSPPSSISLSSSSSASPAAAVLRTQ